MNKQVAHEMRQDPIFGSKQHRKGLSSTDTKLQSASATSIQQSGLPQPIKQAFEHHKSALLNVISEETKSAARKPNFAERRDANKLRLQSDHSPVNEAAMNLAHAEIQKIELVRHQMERVQAGQASYMGSERAIQTPIASESSICESNYMSTHRPLLPDPGKTGRTYRP